MFIELNDKSETYLLPATGNHGGDHFPILPSQDTKEDDICHAHYKFDKNDWHTFKQLSKKTFFYQHHDNMRFFLPIYIHQLPMNQNQNQNTKNIGPDLMMTAKGRFVFDSLHLRSSK